MRYGSSYLFALLTPKILLCPSVWVTCDPSPPPCLFSLVVLHPELSYP